MPILNRNPADRRRAQRAHAADEDLTRRTEQRQRGRSKAGEPAPAESARPGFFNLRQSRLRLGLAASLAQPLGAGL